MSAQRRTGRSITITSALLLSTALAAPAFAAIEEVVVTAQKKAEDVQQVPIAISAFSSQDLAAHQIQGFKDLQFAVPSVTFTHGNFGPSNFQIRGIGSAAVTVSGDPGVAVDLNDIYLAAPPLTNGAYYDTERIEVLRGPQSTLYGRNATGGAINVITNKPDLDNFAADIEGTYGNFNDQEVRAMANLPILDGTLGFRFSGYWQNRDGTIDNIYNKVYGNIGVANHLDSRNLYSFRAAARWEPSSDTTVDMMVQISHENDSRVRAQAQLCERDPSGVLGCLPDRLNFQAINGNATFGTLFASNIGPFNLLGPLAAFALFDVADPTNGAFPGLGAPGLGANAVVPHNLHTVDTDFTPKNDDNDLFYMGQWHQNWTPWLNMDFLFGYDHNKGVSQESYNNGPGDQFANIGLTVAQQLSGLCGIGDGFPFQTNQSLACAQDIFGFATGFGKNWSTYFSKNGFLPTSAVGRNGVTGLNFLDVANRVQAFDQISGHNTNWSTELRFATNFEGPLNGLFGLYHLDYKNDAEYYVNANTLDYSGIVLGEFIGGDGNVFGPTFYDNNSKRYHLSSDAIFGELYYAAIPDTLKFTVGLRYLNDEKQFESRQTLFSSCFTTPSQLCVMPIGTTDWNAFLNTHGYDCDLTTPNVFDPFCKQTNSFSAWTGRALAEWTPKLDFTDQTNIYASYSRGFRSGGFNPPSFTGAFAQTFAPETINSYEVGAKNTLLDGTLIANLTGWYYDYTGYQVSEIIDRTSVNVNIDSTLWGAEGEFFWAPLENLQFNANMGYMHTSIGNTSAIDPRSPTNDTPGATLLKDTNGANCAIINTTGGPAPTAATVVNGFAFASIFATPPTGTAGNSPIPGVAEQAFFLQNVTCQGLQLGDVTLPDGYAYSPGVAVGLSGNEMPLSPHWTLSLGAQYTFNLPGEYNLVPRVDFYWQSKEFGRVFNDGADLIDSWTVTNAQIQLNAPQNLWYARLWVQNAFDADNITGMYLTDPSSALFTNVFVGTRRTYGITVGAHF